ncbi:uncharacterized protein K460DRAFT_31318 [Cucurbitaria berberidis CBS 394.84]|uniref:Uncharacterized protein n=1 Tax=Cucurbitaria berberidis CBS 394.84 TaxID=1168544 RepID=A0A9P4GU35_9PLEO|nr:uncharacterized protein K460DRAFT_31318 [Cucurbitaria berberidis CBS 394.84]KAF1851304.1 hypothetical protein K460DRAFT_31318 [Cucurbitaria berberidis CBS 394.84]
MALVLAPRKLRHQHQPHLASSIGLVAVVYVDFATLHGHLVFKYGWENVGPIIGVMSTCRGDRVVAQTLHYGISNSLQSQFCGKETRNSRYDQDLAASS